MTKFSQSASAGAALPRWVQHPYEFWADRVPISSIPEGLIGWVNLTQSMTAQLAIEFGGIPTVEVCFSGRSAVTEWEQVLLGLGEQGIDRGFVRQIALRVEQRPVLVARSISSIGSSVEPLLSGLQRTPLARVLFEDPNWSREGDITPLANADNTGRVGVWEEKLSGDRLLVEEFFLFE